MISKKEYNLLVGLRESPHIDENQYRQEINLFLKEKFIYYNIIKVPYQNNIYEGYILLPQGERAIEEYEEAMNAHAKRDETVTLAKEANELSKTSNDIAREANRLSKRSNRLSIAAIIISVFCCIATVVATIISGSSCSREVKQHFVNCSQHHFFATAHVNTDTVVSLN